MWADAGWGGVCGACTAGGGWWALAVMLGVLLLVVAAAAVLAVSLGARPPGASGAQGGDSTADRLLDERFARGEIDEEEYRHRRAVLRGRSAQPARAGGSCGSGVSSSPHTGIRTQLAQALLPGQPDGAAVRRDRRLVLPGGQLARQPLRRRG